jgi:RNA polymerase sigma-70 factor (ECF subfamily)
LIQQSVEINQEDLLLLDRIREGNEKAFATLYARYKQPVSLYCVRMLGDPDAAADVYQDVFVKSYEHITQGTAIGNVKSYLFTAARNRCLNAIRDRRHAYDIEEIPDEMVPGRMPEFDLAESLQEALQSLPPLNKEAFLLCEYEGYSYDEAAELTGVPVTTVRKRIFRARQRLRAMLRRDDYV